MVLEHKPAEKLFIDFAGKKLSYVDKETGELVAYQVFVACLPYSDYSFAMAVRTQSTESFFMPWLLLTGTWRRSAVLGSRILPTIMDYGSVCMGKSRRTRHW